MDKLGRIIKLLSICARFLLLSLELILSEDVDVYDFAISYKTPKKHAEKESFINRLNDSFTADYGDNKKGL